jgi:hypothetical protein
LRVIYSITSSARKWIDIGTVRQSALAKPVGAARHILLIWSLNGLEK